ncbi:hypothetical protein E05_46300 [Plautia stali symbiont]|nr:hypothetical protein E05_46300 [Plautia stali symbiont]
MQQTAEALRDFTARYVAHWQQQHGHFPASEELYGVPSPCIISELDERALDIQLQPDLTTFYTTQFAGDMRAHFAQQPLTLLQVWSEADFTRLQENLIGHLVMKRRLKQSPTLFIATTDSEQDVTAVCNLTGEVILEQPGTKKRQLLAVDIQTFFNTLQPVSP